MFPTNGISGLTTFNLFLVLGTLYLVFQSNFSEKLRKGEHENRVKADETTEKIEGILGNVKNTVNMLRELSTDLKGNISVTGELSKDITTIFSSINSCIESEVVSIQEVSASMDAINYNVIEISKATGTFSDYSNGTVNLVNSGNVFITTLAASIGDINEIINKLGEASKVVTEVMSTVTASTEENTSSVAETLNKVEEQNQRISNIINNFNELDELAINLEKLIK